MADATQFINEEVPPQQRALLPKSHQQAYDAVDEWIQENKWLRIPTVQPGHLRAWAVDFALIQLIEFGAWPVRKYEWADFTRPTGKYLKIFTANAVLTVSQLADLTAQPRTAVFRQNASFNNQTFLFPEFAPEISDELPHLILTHGHQQLNFITIAMPHPEDKNAWLASTPNLLNELREVSSELAPPEAVDVQPMLTIKSELTKRLKANDA